MEHIKGSPYEYFELSGVADSCCSWIVDLIDKEYQRDGALKREGGHDNIFDDVGDYVPSDVKDRSYNSKHRHGGDHRSSRSDHDRDRRGGGDYHRSRDEDQHRSSGTRYGGAVGANNGSTYFDKPVEVSFV